MKTRITIESRGHDQCVYEIAEMKVSDLIDRNKIDRNKKEPLINLFLKQDKDNNKERRKNMLEVITTANDEIIILKEGDVEAKSRPDIVKSDYPFGEFLKDAFTLLIQKDSESPASSDTSVTLDCKLRDKKLEIKLNFDTFSIIDKTNNDVILFTTKVCKEDILKGDGANSNLINGAAEALIRLF